MRRWEHKRAHGTVLIAFALLVAAGSMSRAALSVYMTPEQLAQQSSLIVEGTVADVAIGHDPVKGRVATYVTLDVETVHHGPDCERLILREQGGRIGDLVLDVDAVPGYAVGERVFVFIEQAKDGSLRTAGMFFGKYRIVEETATAGVQAVRDLDGKGRIVGRPSTQLEKIEIGDLVSVAAGLKRPDAKALSLVPEEFARLEWQEEPEKFGPISAASPARWVQADSGTPVMINIDRTGDPLGDPVQAVAEIQRALDAWTDVPDSRLTLAMGNDDFDFLANQAVSPAESYSGINIVLFDDPYDDISDPSGCSGVLAVGGYWRSGTLGASVNGIDFYPAHQAYVIFNNDFQCFLGAVDNLAEVATHELGHAIGFGHSLVSDAIMRSSAYGGRGPRLGLDDVDGAHCHYPHSFTVLSPNGGEQWDGGSVQTILWSASQEDGPDAGAVDIEYSTNGGVDWQTLAADEPNDGAYAWLLPSSGNDQSRIRVIRRNNIDPPPPGYPSACSSDLSDGSFRVVAQQQIAGTISDESGGQGLRMDKAAGGEIRLSWGASCSGDADDHAVYLGGLAALRAGSWDVTPVTCAAGADLAEYVTPPAGDVFYLVAPLAAASEGSLGESSAGVTRPVALIECGTREASSACAP